MATCLVSHLVFVNFSQKSEVQHNPNFEPVSVSFIWEDPGLVIQLCINLNQCSLSFCSRCQSLYRPDQKTRTFCTNILFCFSAQRQTSKLGLGKKTEYLLGLHYEGNLIESIHRSNIMSGQLETWYKFVIIKLSYKFVITKLF